MAIETPFGSLIDFQRELSSVYDDIQDICKTGAPDRLSLKQAPRLKDWSHASVLTTCLIGDVTGHPLLGDRARIHTSQLLVIDREEGWARTWSRLYRLSLFPHAHRN